MNSNFTINGILCTPYTHRWFIWNHDMYVVTVLRVTLIVCLFFSRNFVRSNTHPCLLIMVTGTIQIYTSWHYYKRVLRDAGSLHKHTRYWFWMGIQMVFFLYVCKYNRNIWWIFKWLWANKILFKSKTGKNVTVFECQKLIAEENCMSISVTCILWKSLSFS